MNSAQRIVNLAKVITTRPNAHRKSLDVWVEIFGVPQDANSNYFVLKNVSSLISLVFQIDTTIRENENTNNQLYLTPINEVKDALLHHNFHSGWQEFAQKFTPQTIRGLEFVAHEMEKLIKEEEIPAEDLKDIDISIGELYNQVIQADIDKVIKSYILTSLNEIRNSINGYAVFGAQGLRDSLAKTLGNTVIERDAIKDATEKEKGFLTQTMEVLKKASKVLKIFRYGKALAIGYADEIKKLSSG